MVKKYLMRWSKSMVSKKFIPSIEKMSDEEFYLMLESSLEQVQNGNEKPVEEVFKEIKEDKKLKDIKQ